MKVNGLVCETLHPSNKIAKYYKSFDINDSIAKTHKNLVSSNLRLMNRTHAITA